MELTLRSARRLEREIAAEIDNQNAGVQQLNRTAVSIYEKFDEVVNTANKVVIDSVDTAFRLIEIRFQIRKAVETANEKSAINELMNQEALLRAKQKVLTQAMTGELTAGEKEILAKKHAALVASGPVATNYSVTDAVGLPNVMVKETLDAFKAQAKDIHKRLLQIVDQLTALNTTKTITIDDQVIAFLESKGFVL